MYSIAKIEELIQFAENTLAHYKQELIKNPASLFSKGMVKNTYERLSELRYNLAYEKQRREKEIIDLRLKGKLAKVGKLPLELLGLFAKSLSDAITEISRQNQFGDRSGKHINAEIKNTIDLRFERLVPGSTHIIITGKSSPDLFGNSILENALESTFNLLNADNPDQLVDVSNKVGSAGIKKINKVLNLSIENELEFDFEWQAPDMKSFVWNGDISRIQSISNSISKIQINKPLDIEITGKIITLSLKGMLEIQDEDKKLLKVAYPLNLLERVKNYQIGDTCSIVISQKSSVNTVTGEEKINYELKEI